MAMEEKKGVQVIFVLLADIDIQKGFDLGIEIATKVGGVFDGFNVFTFAGNPAMGVQPRDRPTLNFFVDSKHVGDAITSLAKGLGLTQTQYVYQAAPASRYFPRTQASQTSA